MKINNNTSRRWKRKTSAAFYARILNQGSYISEIKLFLCDIKKMIENVAFYLVAPVRCESNST